MDFKIWIGGSCDYGNKERAGAAAAVNELDGKVIDRKQIADLHTTEFRMMLTLMVQLMNELLECSDIIFLTNAVYIQNFDREPGPQSENPDLIRQCIESKKKHSSVSVKIVPYHKSPLLIETHDTYFGMNSTSLKPPQISTIFSAASLLLLSPNIILTSSMLPPRRCRPSLLTFP